MGENYVVKWVFLIVIANYVVFTIGFSSDFPILTKNTYIIQMDKSAMPESFSSHLDWYSSKVKSILVEPEAESDDDQDRIIYSYQNAFHGIAARLSEEEAERLEEEDGVVAVFPDTKIVSGVSLYKGRRVLLEKTEYALVYMGTNSSSPEPSSLCLEGTLDPHVVSGKIVICDRGISPRVQKGQVVKDAGGVGMILTNTASNGEELVADCHLLPAVAVGEIEGKLIKHYVLTNPKATATLAFLGTRTVTNVGPPVSNYHVVVSQFKGCALTVEPTALNFTGKHQKLSYKITFKTKSRQTIPEFGGLIWKDAVHTVRSPIVVTWLPPLRNVSRVESEEDSSWTSTEEESGELVRRNFNRWKGDCSKSVGPVHYLDLAHEKGLSMDPQPELSQGQAEGLTLPTDSEVQLHDADYLADGLKSNVVGLQVSNPMVGQMVVYTLGPVYSIHSVGWKRGEQGGNRLDAEIKRRGSNLMKTKIMQTRFSKKGQGSIVTADRELIVNKREKGTEETAVVATLSASLDLSPSPLLSLMPYSATVRCSLSSTPSQKLGKGSLDWNAVRNICPNYYTYYYHLENWDKQAHLLDGRASAGVDSVLIQPDKTWLLHL
ncbi:hypothetical protein LWI28_024811 [Acer negundo]|uniref:Uncharacterized protein n=1 Tax=Acer negundo TaxID=4023 RepID=A0AAD5IH53_ACENE|nr:hypothetical protein LWI28_024811 [Acer negundo]